MSTPISIVQDPEKPVPAEIIATSIEQIATAMRQISSTRLSRKALVALLHDNSRLPKGTIELVLNNLEYLEHDWLKPKPVQKP